MARLFVTPREIDFFNDIVKEINKDITGQKVYYYRVREDLTVTHEVYEESARKVFDQPVEIESMVKWMPAEVVTNKFGTEKNYKIEVYFHQRDLIDRNIKVREGDFFSYGDVFYEIVSIINNKLIYGQIEHEMGFKAVGRQARLGKINFAPLGPTSERHVDSDAVQNIFVQQRGQEENRLGPTGDKRALQSAGKLDAPLTGPAEVSPKGAADKNQDGTIDSYFYDEK